MSAKGQMTGMLGVYLTAAELTDKGLTVSITSRNAKGADLLATDQSYRRTWAIQVKTNRKAAKFWLLNKSYGIDVSPTHVYIFVNLRGKERPEYYIVPSKIVARDGFTSTSGTGSIWYAYDIRKAKAERYRENWGIFDALPQSE
jgi:hypothetical protein